MAFRESILKTPQSYIMTTLLHEIGHQTGIQISFIKSRFKWNGLVGSEKVMDKREN